MAERRFQKRVIDRLKTQFPGCLVVKNDPSYQQGIPDLLVLYGPSWAMLEVKDEEKAPVQPNQAHFIRQLDGMSYASFIYPGNEEQVFDELQRAFCNPR